MKLTESGGPAYPTLNGTKLDDNTYRFEGKTLFDFYVGQLLIAGKTPTTAVKEAAKVIELRNAHFDIKD
jgi:hypothetical protein